MDKIDWWYLSQNPNAICLLEQNTNKIDWTWLSLQPNAINLLEQNIDKINWNYLSRNPNAIHMLEKSMDKTMLTYGLSPTKVDFKKGEANLCFRINELAIKMSTSRPSLKYQS
jgi:hypothetical protein